MSAKAQVLVVDDEAAILRFLKPALEANGYDMTTAGSIAEATKRIAADSPDMVLLDLGLPDGDGKDVIRRAREWSDVPIIVLSARERETEKIEALDLGADDYVNKPFGANELLARIRAALRHRLQEQGVGRFTSDDLSVDLLRRRVRRGPEDVKLSPKEYDILEQLVIHAGRRVKAARVRGRRGGQRYH